MSTLVLYRYRRNGRFEVWNGVSWTRNKFCTKYYKATKENDNYITELCRAFSSRNPSDYFGVAMCGKNIDWGWFNR